MDFVEGIQAYGVLAVGTLALAGFVLECALPGYTFISSVYYVNHGVTIATLIVCAISLQGYDNVTKGYYALGYFFALLLTVFSNYSIVRKFLAGGLGNVTRGSLLSLYDG